MRLLLHPRTRKSTMRWCVKMLYAPVAAPDAQRASSRRVAPGKISGFEGVTVVADDPFAKDAGVPVLLFSRTNAKSLRRSVVIVMMICVH
jgi:hypothetical protein